MTFYAPSRFLRVIGSSSLLITLAGCSGDSSSSSGDIAPPPTRASFSELATLGQELRDNVAPLEVTPEANMPVKGKATYTGVASYVNTDLVPPDLPDEEYFDYFVDNPEMVSQVEMNADFGTSSLGAKLSNFQYQDPSVGALEGELNLTNGTIAGNTFGGDLSGAIGPTGDVRPTTGGMGGVFVGNTPDYALGGVFLDVGSGDTYIPFDGVFTAKK